VSYIVKLRHQLTKYFKQDAAPVEEDVTGGIGAEV
jgi:hypothetical protein